MEGIAQIILSLLAVFLPPLLKLIMDKASEKNPPQDLEDAQHEALSNLATALKKGNVGDIAAAFAKHERIVPMRKKQPPMLEDM